MISRIHTCCDHVRNLTDFRPVSDLSTHCSKLRRLTRAVLPNNALVFQSPTKSQDLGRTPAISARTDTKTSPTHRQVVLIAPGRHTTESPLDMSCICPLDHPYLKGGHRHAPCTTGPSGPILTLTDPSTTQPLAGYVLITQWSASDHPAALLPIQIPTQHVTQETCGYSFYFVF
jgi:hypothetical protein